MARTVFFGDIHGCWREWESLCDKLAVTRFDRLIAVGDLVCKGPSTARTLGLALGLPNLTCLRGNHERQLLAAWKSKGGEACERSALRELGDRKDLLLRFIASWPLSVEGPGWVARHGDEGDSPEAWTGPKTLVFGHRPRRRVLLGPKAVGLDTGCVYGGRLSALVWPERKVVSVKARQTYAVKKGGWA